MTPAQIARVLRQQRHLRQHDRWTRRELEVHQAGALRDLRDFAASNSAFYREFHRGLGARPLHELPVLTKATLMSEFDRLVTAPDVTRDALADHVKRMASADLFLDRFRVASTSGTTGMRGLFLWDEHEWATVLASYARANDWAGVPVGITRRVKMAVVSSRTPWHQSAVVAASADSRWMRTLRLGATDPMARTVSELNAFQPEVLVAYASMGHALAEEQRGGRLAIEPRAVICASEVLAPETRRWIREAFGSEPFDVYAATETAGVASECARHRMHLYEDLVIAEVVDEENRAVPIGEPGAKVLVTVLFSRTLPLIRYEMSDCLRLSADACDCGRPYGLVAGIEGRREDVLQLPGSAGPVAIHPNTFHDVLDLVPSAGWQVVQEPDGLRVLVAGAASLDDAALASSIGGALRAHGAEPGRVRVEHVDGIPRTPLGKAPLVKKLQTAKAP